MTRPASFTPSDVERLEALGLTRREIAKELKVHENYLYSRLGQWGKTGKYINHKKFYPVTPLPAVLYDTAIAKQLRAISTAVQGREDYDFELLQRGASLLDGLVATQQDLAVDGDDENAEWTRVAADKKKWWAAKIHKAVQDKLQEILNE